MACIDLKVLEDASHRNLSDATPRIRSSPRRSPSACAETLPKIGTSFFPFAGEPGKKLPYVMKFELPPPPPSEAPPPPVRSQPLPLGPLAARRPVLVAVAMGHGRPS